MVRSPFLNPHGWTRTSTDSAHRPEIWGGVEPTVNRVGDRYFDQLVRTGHATRIDDLDRFADLGITAVRYPVLWEKIAPDRIEDADWAWPDARLTRLHRLGILPIVGLVHHGSGPLHTSLVDPEFPEKLAAYAGAVARRYPWIEDYTPVNEPLTTARFSALYGHWYPHERNDSSFARALIGQCRAVALAMQAIREVNPRAQLIQTDDVGMVHSTPKLAYQAEFENERRWLTFDLLTGKLTPERRLWRWLQESGIAGQELEWFLDNPCLPDVLGINYYLTSERYLDHRIKRYPGECIGTNGSDRYVDVCAARVLRKPIDGVEALLHQAWERYGIPISITEVHNGSTREEQLRWLHEVWHHAVRARSKGVDVRAITIWALLGSYDWASLVTEDAGHYEPGAFDLRGPEPRPTALARMIRDLADHGSHDHPVLDVPGWWRRPDRHGPYTPPTRRAVRHRTYTADDDVGIRSVLIIAGDPTLTSAMTAACGIRHIPATVVDGEGVDGIEERLARGEIWAIIAASIDDVTTGESEPFHALIDLSWRYHIPCMRFAGAAAEVPARAAISPWYTRELVIVADHDEPSETAFGSVVDSLAHLALDLLVDGERGVWCLAPSPDGSLHAAVMSDKGIRLIDDAADD